MAVAVLMPKAGGNRLTCTTCHKAIYTEMWQHHTTQSDRRDYFFINTDDLTKTAADARASVAAARSPVRGDLRGCRDL